MSRLEMQIENNLLQISTYIFRIFFVMPLSTRRDWYVVYRLETNV